MVLTTHLETIPTFDQQLEIISKMSKVSANSPLYIVASKQEVEHRFIHTIVCSKGVGGNNNNSTYGAVDPIHRPDWGNRHTPRNLGS
jgi:hypothetical protein